MRHAYTETERIHEKKLLGSHIPLSCGTLNMGKGSWDKFDFVLGRYIEIDREIESV